MRIPVAIALLAPLIVQVQGLWKPFRQLDRIYPSSIEYYKSLSEVDTKEFKQDMRRMAEAAMLHGPYSVTYKKKLPPSGNVHDYYSFAIHWWPDCPKNATVNDPTHECDYHSIDGEANPDVHDIGDHEQLQNMAINTITLTVAWELLDIDRFAEKAAALLRTWFIDPETRMNPNADFSQTIRGTGPWAGRAAGTIDFRYLLQAANAAAILRQSAVWTKEDHQAMTKWYQELVQWYTTSNQGVSVNQMKNNVKTWYHAQLAGYYMFLDQPKLAGETIQTFLAKDFAQQIAADGSQPLELRRTSQMHNSNFNLEALILLAKIGDEVDVNVWQHKTEQGASIMTAVQYLAAQDLDADTADELRQYVAVARAKYGDDVFKNLNTKHKEKYAATNETGLIGMTNDRNAPAIDADHAWPIVKKPSNPSAESVAIQEIKNTNDVNWQNHKLQGLDANVQRGGASGGRADTAFWTQNIVIGLGFLNMIA